MSADEDQQEIPVSLNTREIAELQRIADQLGVSIEQAGAICMRAHMMSVGNRSEGSKSAEIIQINSRRR